VWQEDRETTPKQQQQNLKRELPRLLAGPVMLPGVFGMITDVVEVLAELFCVLDKTDEIWICEVQKSVGCLLLPKTLCTVMRA
jgi:hypothetical protein